MGTYGMLHMWRFTEQFRGSVLFTFLYVVSRDETQVFRLGSKSSYCWTVSPVPFLPILQPQIKKTEETLVCFCLLTLLIRFHEVNLHCGTSVLVEVMVGISVSLVQNWDAQLRRNYQTLFSRTCMPITYDLCCQHPFIGLPSEKDQRFVERKSE